MARFRSVVPGDRDTLAALVRGSTSCDSEYVEDCITRWCSHAERAEVSRQDASWRASNRQNGRGRSEAHIYELEDRTVVGAYTMQAAGNLGGVGNGVASAGRIAQCDYMLATSARVDGSFHKAICMHSLRSAAQAGYTGVQLNLVSSADGMSVQAYIACGFVIACALPDAFQVGCALVEGLVMFCSIRARTSVGLADALVVSSDRAAAPRLQIGIVNHGSRAEDCHDGDVQKRGRSCNERGSSVGVGASTRHSTVSDFRMETVLTSEVCASQVAGHESLGGNVLYTVYPELPEGLQLDPQTGEFSGSFDISFSGNIFCVSVSSNAWVSFALEDLATTAGEDFATKLEAIASVADLPSAPPKHVCFGGDWMLWMVHRTWLDDPSLTELDFTGMQMPLPHIEPRIATKLMSALSWNSHIEVVSLSNSNLQNTSGFELANALEKNTALRNLNIESNFIDSSVVKNIALAIRSNRQSRIEELSVAHQKLVGKFFGRPTEEALGQMMQGNECIVKLGIECDDKHWRNVIDRALLRNNDLRRQPLPMPCGAVHIAAEERTFGQLILCGAPPGGETGMSGDIAGGSARVVENPSKITSPTKVRSPLRTLSPSSAPHPSDPCVFRDYVLKNLRVPTVPQLQSYIRNVGGAPLQYTVAAPLIKEWLCRMLDAAETSDVVAADAFQMTARGILESWSETNGTWNFDVAAADGRRLVFKSKTEPSVAVSEAWAKWLADQIA